MVKTMFKRHKVNVTVRTPAEYREAVSAAETLGLSLSVVDAYGYGWESPEAEAIHPGAGGTPVDIRKVGRKYFHMALSGPGGTEVVPVECGRAPDSLEDAELVLRFD